MKCIRLNFVSNLRIFFVFIFFLFVFNSKMSSSPWENETQLPQTSGQSIKSNFRFRRRSSNNKGIKSKQTFKLSNWRMGTLSKLRISLNYTMGFENFSFCPSVCPFLLLSAIAHMASSFTECPFTFNFNFISRFIRSSIPQGMRREWQQI